MLCITDVQSRQLGIFIFPYGQSIRVQVQSY